MFLWHLFFLKENKISEMSTLKDNIPGFITNFIKISQVYQCLHIYREKTLT